MDHVVYLDTKAAELAKLLSGEKTMIIRGATGKKIPYGRVNAGDLLYLVENDSSGLIQAKTKVVSAFNSEKMDQVQSIALVEEYQDHLQLTEKQLKRWVGKRYLVLVEVDNVEVLDPFSFDKSNYDNMDDWFPVGDISRVKL